VRGAKRNIIATLSIGTGANRFRCASAKSRAGAVSRQFRGAAPDDNELLCRLIAVREQAARHEYNVAVPALDAALKQAAEIRPPDRDPRGPSCSW